MAYVPVHNSNPPPKRRDANPFINVLCANKLSFDTFMALGVTDTEKRKYKYIFVEKVSDLKRGKVKMLGDFPMHPNYEGILWVVMGNCEYIN